MEHTFLLAVPRMHPPLPPMPQGCLSFWPGLPDMPQGTWQPGLPWTGQAASACLADLERAVRDGASGAPVQAFTAGRSSGGLSPSEREALEELTGTHAGTPPDDLRLNAQQTLLLAWLRERQSLEIARLEAAIDGKRSALNALISGRRSAVPRETGREETALPAWRASLAAMLAFLPDMPSPCTFFVNCREMAEELTGRDGPGSVAPAGEGMLSGCKVWGCGVPELAGLCGRPAFERLRSALPGHQWQRTIGIAMPLPERSPS
ncbi:MAG: hypothetical protein II737_01030 [Mailhella sp.]|nr:hypothetical protein [Mailhella sp.]